MSEELDKLTGEYLAKAIEHCDGIQVIASLHEGGPMETGTWQMGAGNYHARLGSVQEWLDEKRQYTRTYADIKQRKTLEGD